MNQRSMCLPQIVALCCLLTGLVTTASSHAAELYRWIETDGSITFSPTPPASGIDYEKVDASGAADPAASSETMNSAELDAALSEVRSEQQLASPVSPPGADTTANDVDGLSYAPPPLGAASDAGSGVGTGASLPSLNAAFDSDQTDPSNASVTNPTDVRRTRCRDLAKRVISLERRLSTRLSPEDMDNTVLYMAHYQSSVDKHCRF